MTKVIIKLPQTNMIYYELKFIVYDSYQFKINFLLVVLISFIQLLKLNHFFTKYKFRYRGIKGFKKLFFKLTFLKIYVKS